MLCTSVFCSLPLLCGFYRKITKARYESLVSVQRANMKNNINTNMLRMIHYLKHRPCNKLVVAAKMCQFLGVKAQT